MKIEIYTSAQTVGQKASRRTACALVLLAIHDDGRAQSRRMQFALSNSTVNLAGLQAARLALMSLRNWVLVAKPQVILYTDSVYACDMLARDDGGAYRLIPRSNIDVVASLRDWYERLPGLVLAHQKTSAGIGATCLALARDAAVSQANADGGTKEHADAKEAGAN